MPCLRRFFPGWWRGDWLWSPIDPALNPCWQQMPDNFVLSTKSDRLWLKPRGRFVPSGWYLFSICHLSDNQRAVGYLTSGAFGVRQGRPMYPLRNRLRIIHVNRTRPLQLELQRVGKPVEIQRLRLIRIPFASALRRMRLRLKRSGFPGIPSKIFTWSVYNRLLNSQASRHAFVSYLRWQQQVERHLIDQVNTYQILDLEEFLYNIPGL